jgi:hypothetical protein
MAIIKANARVKYLEVEGDVIYAKVQLTYQQDSTSPNTDLDEVNTRLVVTNASSAELTAAQSLVSKAAALAVA